MDGESPPLLIASQTGAGKISRLLLVASFMMVDHLPEARPVEQADISLEDRRAPLACT